MNENTTDTYYSDNTTDWEDLNSTTSPAVSTILIDTTTDYSTTVTTTDSSSYISSSDFQSTTITSTSTPVVTSIKLLTSTSTERPISSSTLTTDLLVSTTTPVLSSVHLSTTVITSPRTSTEYLNFTKFTNGTNNITTAPKPNVLQPTTASVIDPDTLYILIGAISFVFITSLICITLCTVYHRKKKKVSRTQEVVLNKSAEENRSPDSSINLLVPKSVKSPKNTSMSTSISTSIRKVFESFQRKSPSPKSKISFDSSRFNSWPTTFSALSTSKSKSKSLSPPQSKISFISESKSKVNKLLRQKERI